MQPKNELGSSVRADSSSLSAVDREAIQQAKIILTLFAHTVTTIRLYPSRHENVTKITDEFFSGVSRFLEDRGELEIGIEEKAFTFGGEVVYRDESSLKKLSYLFFKDGMRALTFLPGLSRNELADFLEVVKANAELPSEESDIVDALWGGDFEHLRYEAPEEFLINKMAPAQQPEEIQIDRKALYSGRIDLDQTDLTSFNIRLLEIGRALAKNPAMGADFYTEFDQSDLKLMESMLASDRNSSSDRELIETLTEVLFLEDRRESFLEVLTFVSAYFGTLVERAALADAIRLMETLTELQAELTVSAPERAEAAGRTLRQIIEAVDPKIIRDIARPERISEPRWFFEFLLRFDLRLLRTGAETVEAVQDPAWRAAGVEYLRIMIRNHPAETAALAQDRKPVFTKTLISLLAERADKKANLLLLSIARGENPEIREEVVRALGLSTDDLARKAVLEFLHDPDDHVRLAAAKAARLEIDRRTLDQIIKETTAKDFLARSSDEKAAFFLALGRTDTVEAAAALSSILRRRSLFGRDRVREARLLAVAGLAAMTRPEALETLRNGAGSSKRAVAEACVEALKRFDQLREGAK
jgi:hypothetical protein